MKVNGKRAVFNQERFDRRRSTVGDREYSKTPGDMASIHRGNGVLEWWSDGTEKPILQYSNTPLSILLLLKPREYLLRVLVKNFLLVFRRQPRDALDIRPHVVVPFSGARVGFRTGAGALGTEEATFGAADAKQQLQRLNVVKRAVEVELLQPLIEVLGVVGAAQLRAPAPDLIRHRAAAMGNDQFQFGKVFEDVGIDQRQDRDALLGDEVAAKRLARIFATRPVNQTGNIHFHHLLVKRIPVFRAHGWRLPVAFARIRIDHDADEAQVVDAAIDLVEGIRHRDS